MPGAQESDGRHFKPADTGAESSRPLHPAAGPQDSPPLDTATGPSQESLGSSEAILFYHSMFQDVPLWSGREWSTMSAEAIAERFKVAALHVVHSEESYQRGLEESFAEAQREYQARSSLVKFFLKAPEPPQHQTPTLGEIHEEMAARCERLALWMEETQHRAFYMDSDMSAYITKPRTVAALLRQATAHPSNASSA
jgi:hypothetical protein